MKWLTHFWVKTVWLRYNLLNCTHHRNAGSSTGVSENFSNSSSAGGSDDFSNSFETLNNDPPGVIMPGVKQQSFNPYMMKPKNTKDKSYCDLCEKWISKYYLKEHMSRISNLFLRIS